MQIGRKLHSRSLAIAFKPFYIEAMNRGMSPKKNNNNNILRFDNNMQEDRLRRRAKHKIINSNLHLMLFSKDQLWFCHDSRHFNFLTKICRLFQCTESTVINIINLSIISSSITKENLNPIKCYEIMRTSNKTSCFYYRVLHFKGISQSKCA